MSSENLKVPLLEELDIKPEDKPLRPSPTLPSFRTHAITDVVPRSYSTSHLDATCIRTTFLPWSYSSFLPVEEASSSRAKSKSLGLLAVAVIVIGQVAISETVKFTEKVYDKPYFTIWFNHSWMVIFMAPLAFQTCSGKANPAPSPASVPGTFLRLWYGRHFGQVFGLMMCFSTLYLVLNWCWALALPRTAVSTFMAISEASSALVFVLSVLILNEPVTLLKVACVFISMGGVALIALGEAESSQTAQGDSHGETRSLWDQLLGVIFAVGYSAGYALYQVLYEKYVGGMNLQEVCLFLGLLGTTTMLCLWVGLPFVAAVAGEEFELPRGTVAMWVVLNAIIATANNFSLMFGISVASPLFISIGYMMTLPVSMLVDAILYSVYPSLWSGLGAGCIAAGFLVLSMPDGSWPCHNFSMSKLGDKQ